MTHNDKSNMTIIGGTRGLGRWLAEHLKNDFNIRITSRDESSGKPVAEEIGVEYNSNNIESIRDADIIVFSVPIEYMVETIKEVAPHAPEGSLLMDVASVKTEPSDALEKYAPENAEILPCHPMFSGKCRDIAMPPYVWSESPYTQKANHHIDPYRKQIP